MISTISLFNKNIQQQLEKDGFCVLPSFLKPEQIDLLFDFYRQQFLNYDQTKPNYLFVSPEQSRNISEKIKAVLFSSVENFFEQCNLLGGVFMIKKPGQNKAVHFHQDWSLVDESLFTSYNLWCPLSDTERHSGALMMLKKSHLCGMKQRSSTFPPLEIDLDEVDENYIETINYKAGDAVLYNHALFHGSESNSSEKDRVAIACGILPEGAPFLYQHWNESKSVIEQYEVDNDFYITHIHEVLTGKIPEKYNCINTIYMPEKPYLQKQEFLEQMKKKHQKKRRFLFFDF